MPGRNYNAANRADYSYGFNGKLNDNDVKGVEGGQQDYGMRIYDPRMGKFLSVDPITKKYPELTPYQFASNNPIAGIDLDGLEFLSTNKAYMEQQFSLYTKYLQAQASKPVHTNPPKPVIQPTHSETVVQMQQLSSRVSSMKPLSPEQERQRMLAAIRKNYIENQSYMGPAKPPGPANEFEAGAVQGTHMFAVAIATEACPSCAIAYGASELSNGISEGNSSKIVNGSLFLVPILRPFKGSGPASGILEVSAETKSVEAFKNYSPPNPIEFVYDYNANKFLVGKPNQTGIFGGSPHQKLVRAGNLNGNTTVGGMFRRGENGEIITNEFSGHYGENWTPQITEAFKNFMESTTGQKVDHKPW